MANQLIRSIFAALCLFVPHCGFSQGRIGDSYIATWKNNAKAAYSLTTDDDRPSQVYTIAPALTERGLHGTFYVNPSLKRYWWAYSRDIGDVNGDGLADGYLHLPEQGHELASHTLDHWAVTVGHAPNGFPNAVFPSYEALAEDCQYVNQYLESVTGQRVVSFAYPWGWYDTASENVVNDYYLSARTTSYYGPRAGHYVANPATPPNMMRLLSYLVEGNDPWADFHNHEQATAAYRQMLDDTVAVGGWGIEYFHSTGDDWIHYPSPITAVDEDAYYDHLDNIVNRIASGDIWQDTVGNVSRYIRSRNGASIEYDETSAKTIQLRIDDALDDDLFCVPLTVNTAIPDSWLLNRVRITHNGQPIGYSIHVDPVSGAVYARYDVIADGGATVLSSIGLGDYDADGNVDRADYERWRSDFGMTVAVPGLGADGNGNGIVDAADYSVWRDNLLLQPFGIAGDYDRDGDVDEADLDRWRIDFGTSVAKRGLGADGNCDGVVNAADYTVWRDNLPLRPSGILGDYDRDGDVDEADHDRWRLDFGTSVAAPGFGADGNCDGVVDAADYTVWRDNFISDPALIVVPVPEPSALVTLVTGLAVCLAGRALPHRRFS